MTILYDSDFLVLLLFCFWNVIKTTFYSIGAKILTTERTKRLKKPVFCISRVTSMDFAMVSSMPFFKSLIESHWYIHIISHIFICLNSEVAASRSEVCAYAQVKLSVSPIVPKAHFTRRSLALRSKSTSRSAQVEHLIQKSLICLVDKLGFFVETLLQNRSAEQVFSKSIHGFRSVGRLIYWRWWVAKIFQKRDFPAMPANEAM